MLCFDCNNTTTIVTIKRTTYRACHTCRTHTKIHCPTKALFTAPKKNTIKFTGGILNACITCGCGFNECEC